MIFLKRTLCCLAGMLLLAGMLTGCGAKEDAAESTADTASSSESAQDEEKGTEPAPEQMAENEAASRGVLEHFLEGCRQKDLDAVLAVADYRGLLLEPYQDSYSEEQFREDLSSMLFSHFDSYEIGELTSKYQDLVRYNTDVSSLRKVIEATEENPYDPQAAALLQFLRKNLKAADQRCVYAVTVSSDGVQETDEIALNCIDGKWMVDLVPQAAGELLQCGSCGLSRADYAGAEAAKLFDAAARALSEMRTENESGLSYALRTLPAGAYSFTGPELAAAEQPASVADEADFQAELCRRVRELCPELTQFAELAISIGEDGTCSAAAAGVLYEEGMRYGICPPEDGEAADSAVQSIGDALKAAEEQG